MKIPTAFFSTSLLLPLPALASSGGGGDAFGIIVSLVMVVAMAILIAVNNGARARQNELVKIGKAIFFVKISATGRVYHSK